jgi:hypothetical protein
MHFADEGLSVPIGEARLPPRWVPCRGVLLARNLQTQSTLSDAPLRHSLAFAAQGRKRLSNEANKIHMSATYRMSRGLGYPTWTQPHPHGGIVQVSVKYLWEPVD